MGSRAGVTLLEVLLAISLLAVLLAMLFQFSQTTMQAEQVGRELATRSQLARVVLDQISEEIRQAVAYGTPISGDKNSIRILTTRLPEREVFERRKLRDRLKAVQYDLAEVRYYLKIYEDEYVELEDGTEVPRVAGLYRREWRILGHDGRPSPAQGMSALPQAVKIMVGYKELELEPVVEGEEPDVIDLNPGIEEVFAPEIKAIRFAYHDGRNWVDKWAYQEEELTEEGEEGYEVQSETMMDRDEYEEEDEEEYHEDRYTMVVRLYQSDPTGLGSKLVRISDELREQFGGMGDMMGGMGGLGDLNSLTGGGTGGLDSLRNLGNLGDLNNLGNLQNLSGGGANRIREQLQQLQGQLGGGS